MSNGPHAASFRDPSGFLFHHEGTLYRQVNRSYEADYNLLRDSGLYDLLTEKGLLIPHREASLDLARSGEAVRILEPELVPFISYPYEWCFGQLKDAALTTLRIQRRALEHGMALKDSSAYNIQFYNGRPLLIDTLSFEKYREGMPWIAYRQFCQHFLAPLALMCLKDVRLNQLLRIYIDGIPLDLASRILPLKSRFKLPLLTHIHGAIPIGRRGDHPAVGAKLDELRRVGRDAILRCEAHQVPSRTAERPHFVVRVVLRLAVFA